MGQIKNIKLHIVTDIKNNMGGQQSGLNTSKDDLVFVKHEEGEDDEDTIARLVANSGGGKSFQVCDINRLKRFIVLGSETNTYYSTKEDVLAENVLCVRSLLNANRHKEVLDVITTFSKSGRVPKEEPILVVLALCATHESLEIRKAAYSKVNEICNIPTKLFRFLQLTQNDIDEKRKSNPPPPQLLLNPNKRKRTLAHNMNELTVAEKIAEEGVEVKKEEE